MTAVKITKKDYYNAIMAVLNGGGTDIPVADMVAFCEKEINALTTRAEKAKERAAEKRAEGDELQAAVLAALTDEPATRQDVAARIEGEDVTVAKVGYRLTQLVKAGHAVKEDLAVVGEDGKNKKVAGYRLA